jgi:hypothetical protein
MLPVTDLRKKNSMNNSAPYDHMPAGYAEDRPFRMSETTSIALTEIEERTDSLPRIPNEADRIHFPRNHFFGGICLALPLSGLLWVLIIYVL